MTSVILGILYSNIAEWMIHKHLLHTLGKRRGSFWSFHFHEHHRRTTKGRGLDSAYEDGGFYGKEILAGLLLAASQLPFYHISPIFFFTTLIYMIIYYLVHVKSHKDIAWAKRWLPWHYDHHMGPVEAANWGVVLPLADYMAGTRVKYIGTQKYYLDELKRNKN